MTAPSDTTAVTHTRPAFLRRFLTRVVPVVVLLFAGYTWFTLTWSYSEGERSGYLQKFSKKGYLSKTWEGELTLIPLPGAAPEKFLFSVRDDAVAAEINAHMGQKISVRYKQHIGVPTTLFGDTGYFADGVRALGE